MCLSVGFCLLLSVSAIFQTSIAFILLPPHFFCSYHFCARNNMALEWRTLVFFSLANRRALHSGRTFEIDSTHTHTTYRPTCIQMQNDRAKQWLGALVIVPLATNIDRAARGARDRRPNATGHKCIKLSASPNRWSCN